MIEILDPYGITKIKPCLEDVKPDLILIDDIIKGERQLLEKADIYIPQDIAETDSGYQSRLSRASLTNYVKKVRNVAVSMILHKAFFIENDPLNFEEYATSDGQSLKSFCRSLLRYAWQDGFALCFVDYPRVEGEIINLAQERALGLRPYFSVIRRKQLMDWDTELKTSVVGDRNYYMAELSYLKIKVSVEQSQSPQIMEYETQLEGNTRWTLWESVEVKEKKKEWQVVGQGELSVNFIPVSPLYIDQTGFFDAELPLLDIAQLTKHHFTVSSDCFQLLHLIANPKFALYGVDRNEIDMSSSMNEGLMFENPSARMEWTALTGVNTDPLDKKLEAIEEVILSSVLQIFQPKKQAESGIAKEMDREQNNSLLVLTAEGLESCLNNAFVMASAYSGSTPATIAVNQDFHWGSLDAQDLQGLLNLYLSNVITHRTLLEKLESKGYFQGQDFDIDSELENLAGASD